MVKTGGDPSQIKEQKKLGIISDSRTLEKIVNKVLKENPQAVADYKKGKKKIIQFLVGQVMKETKGQANPKIIPKLIRKKLELL
jgi:aspartyl-tRNA(Asn)/glutamyl-tRNA(Gln) amidotransferase subunit B